MKKLVLTSLAFLIIIVSGCALMGIKTPEQIYQEADYTVLISGQNGSTTLFLGSGVILNLPGRGLCVLTAKHVVTVATSAMPSVTFLAYFKNSDTPQRLELIGQAQNYDAALFKFSDPKFQPPRPAVIGKAYDLQPGSKVMAIGSCRYGSFWFSADGYLTTYPGKPDPGLSAIWARWSLQWPTTLMMHLDVFLGFSGGPVLNQRGELVGIVVGVDQSELLTVGIALPIEDVLKDTFEKP